MFGNIAINNCELVVMAHWALHVGYFGYKGSYNLFFFILVYHLLQILERWITHCLIRCNFYKK